MAAIGVGLSERSNTRRATEQALGEAIETLGGAPVRGVMVFAAPRYDHQEMLDTLVEAVGAEIPLIGCTGDAVMTHRGYTDDGLVVVLVGGEDVVVRAAVGRDLSTSLTAAAHAATEGCLDGHATSPTWAVVLPDGLHGDKSELMRALSVCVAEHGGFPVYGGAASDEFEFTATRQFFGCEVLSNSVPMMTVQDSSPVGHGVGYGWCPIGAAYTATRTEGEVLLQLNGEPALDVIARALGGFDIAALLEYPLAVCDEQGDVMYLRSVLSADEDSGGVRMVGSVPEGASVRFTIVREGDILVGSTSAAECAIADLPNGIAGGLVFSCAARKTVLGVRVVQEHARIRQAMGPDTPWAGFYGYGELLATSPSSNAMHNITCVIAAIGRAAVLVS